MIQFGQFYRGQAPLPKSLATPSTLPDPIARELAALDARVQTGELRLITHKQSGAGEDVYVTTDSQAAAKVAVVFEYAGQRVFLSDAPTERGMPSKALQHYLARTPNGDNRGTVRQWLSREAPAFLEGAFKTDFVQRPPQDERHLDDNWASLHGDSGIRGRAEKALAAAYPSQNSGGKGGAMGGKKP